MGTNNNFTRTDDGKAASIISYFGILWLVAYFAMYEDKKTDLSTYQLRQSLLINILYVIVGIAGNIILKIIPSEALSYFFIALYFVLAIIWVVGLYGAIQGQKKPMPLIGERAQMMFPGI